MSDSINPINNGIPINRVCCATDYEYEMIKRRLMQYGLKPSGSKSRDKARLHEIELREAKKENAITTKFLTVSTNEQQKIQDKKKKKKVEINPEMYPETMKGQRILGEQLMLAIEMKKKQEKADKKKREDKKKSKGV